MHGGEGPNMERREGTGTSMDEGDAERMAEMPKDARKVADGIREVREGASNVHGGEGEYPTRSARADGEGGATGEPDEGLEACSVRTRERRGSTG